MRIRGSLKTIAFFLKVNEHLERAQTNWLTPIAPKGKPLGSHMVGWKISGSPRYPHYDWVDHKW
jgi:hypothetical protein